MCASSNLDSFKSNKNDLLEFRSGVIFSSCLSNLLIYLETIKIT